MNPDQYNVFVYKFLQFDDPLKLAALKVCKLWEDCEKCDRLAESRTRVVFGSGNPNARLMFIGEGPGENEDEDGVPFVGRAGDLLNAFIAAAGMTRSDVWVDNMVMCRPTKEADGRVSNRPPTMAEAMNCRNRIWEVIRLVDPWLIVALGATALKGLTGDNQLSIVKVRGDVFTVRVPGIYRMIEYPMIAMQHPAYVLRDETETVYSRKWWFKEDFKFAMRVLKLATKLYGRKKG